MKRRFWKPTRRAFLAGGVGLIAAPAIVKAAGWLPLVKSGGLGLQTNLSAFWQFENTSWTDELGVNDLTGTNSPTSVSGLVGNAVKFTSGASMKLTHANAAALTLGGGNFSFQIWVNLVSGTNPGDGTIMSKNGGGFGNDDYRVGVAFDGTGNSWNWSFYDSSSSLYTVFKVGAAPTTGWHHIVGTWDGTTQRIYYDAGTPGTATPSGTPNAGTSTFSLGLNVGTGVYASASQDVLIDLVAPWKNRVLSAGDVSLLYNGGAGLSYAAMA